MAPAVLGNKRTLQQMLIYAILTILASLTPLVLNEAGWLYTGVVLLLDILLIRKVIISNARSTTTKKWTAKKPSPSTNTPCSTSPSYSWPSSQTEP